jgi:hypothetical protein
MRNWVWAEGFMDAQRDTNGSSSICVEEKLKALGVSYGLDTWRPQ